MPNLSWIEGMSESISLRRGDRTCDDAMFCSKLDVRRVNRPITGN